MIEMRLLFEKAEVIRMWKPYQTLLYPPPAHPRVTHPPRRGKH